MLNPPDLAVEPRLAALFEEYRALYLLVEFRMTSLDRRVPVTGGTLVASVAAVGAVSRDTQFMLLTFVPLALIWFVRATINHARSFEDVLSRLVEIELQVNQLVGMQAMTFQASHPSRNRNVGGRTGKESVAIVVATSLSLMLAMGWRMHSLQLLPWPYEQIYVLGAAAIAGWVIWEASLLTRYSYSRGVQVRIEP